MLAVLSWLVEIIRASEQMDRDHEVEDFAGFEDNGDPQYADKIFYEYLTKTYSAFLAGQDNYQEWDAELREIFGTLRFNG
jgi:SMC interacting uncharacterized protein involved in chromosome segregation